MARGICRKSANGRRSPAQVPGDVYSALLRSRKIPDPFYRDNENRLQWIGRSDWLFSRTFKVPAELLERERVLLRCEGLDTFATVRINGRKVASTDNMFRTYEWDVKHLLGPGENRIDIAFKSVVPYTFKKQAEHPIANWSVDRSAGIFGWVRKQQCNFGWDWGQGDHQRHLAADQTGRFRTAPPDGCAHPAGPQRGAQLI